MVRMSAALKCVLAKIDADQVVVRILDVVADIDIVAHIGAPLPDIGRRQPCEFLSKSRERSHHGGLGGLVKTGRAWIARELGVLGRKSGLLEFYRFLKLAGRDMR